MKIKKKDVNALSEGATFRTISGTTRQIRHRSYRISIPRVWLQHRRLSIRFPICNCALLLAFFSAGCASVRPEKKGDVLLYESDGTPPTSIFGLAMAAHSLEFPKVPIGKEGSTVIRVRNLPVAVIPGEAGLTVGRWELDRPAGKQPWRSAVFQLRISESSGKIIHERTIRLRDWEGQSHSDHWFAPPRIFIPIVPWELVNHPPASAKNYDLTVTVSTPSCRKSDWLSIRASRSCFDSLEILPMDLPRPTSEAKPAPRR